MSIQSIATGNDASLQSLVGRDILGLQEDAERIAAANGPAATGVDGAAGPSFGHLLERVNAQDQEAQNRMEAVERGESDDLVGAMLSSQQAGLSFQMLLQARNKVMGALDDLIKLQL